MGLTIMQTRCLLQFATVWARAWAVRERAVKSRANHLKGGRSLVFVRASLVVVLSVLLPASLLPLLPLVHPARCSLVQDQTSWAQGGGGGGGRKSTQRQSDARLPSSLPLRRHQSVTTCTGTAAAAVSSPCTPSLHRHPRHRGGPGGPGRRSPSQQQQQQPRAC